MSSKDRKSIKILKEAIDLQIRKGQDYQNPNSTVRQADYYPHGVWSIYDVMNAKLLRIKSVLETMEADGSHNQNFESLEDSAKDLINYTSFFGAYLTHDIEGQILNRDIFNKYVDPNDDNSF